MSFALFLQLVLHTVLHTRPGRSFSVNRTVDDEYGDSLTGIRPSYSGNSTYGWQQGATCTTCVINTRIIDVNKAFDGTWQDTTYHVGDVPKEANVTFTGTAVYVFFIVPNLVPDHSTFINTSFFVDDNWEGAFSHEPNGSSIVEYDVSVFSMEGLEDGQHVLRIEASGEDQSTRGHRLASC